MRWRPFVPLIVLLGFSIAHAQVKSGKLGKLADQQSLLWRIEGNGLKQPSYVFGTIHMICADHYFWTAAMEKALSSTRQLCLELPLADTNMQETTMEALALPEGELLSDYFSPEDYQHLSNILKDSLQMPIAAFEQFKPFLIYSLLAIKSADCENPLAYENKLMDSEKERHLPVIGLETVSEQLQLFDQMPKEDLSKMIVKLAGHLSESRKQYQQMVVKYTQQDLSGLYQLMLDTPDFAQFKEVLLDDRNKRWIPHMKAIMDTTSTFFAVGAGHLPGDNGVLQLLKAAGYRVTAVK